MKVVARNLKQNEVKVVVETGDDGWCLAQVVQEGDVIKGKTYRKVKVSEETEATKRVVFLSIVVEKIEFAGSMTRFGGKIVDGPEDVPRGSYHTFNIENGSEVTIVKKEWLGYQLERIEEAARVKRGRVLICVFDREDAFFALVKSAGVEMLAHLQGEVERKAMSVQVTRNFYEQIVQQLEEYDARFDLASIVVASPSFWKEELLKCVKSKAIKKKLVQASCSSANERAIDEVLKRSEVQQALQEERSLAELLAVEKVLELIAKNGAVVYGLKQVSHAASAGAVDMLVVTDSLLQKYREEKSLVLESVLREVDVQKGKVLIVAAQNTAGKKLAGLGGIASVLRYKLVSEQ